MLTDPIPGYLEESAGSGHVLAASLDDILITGQLLTRPHRKPNPIAESKALHTLARVMATAPEKLPESLLQLALELCRAGTAGISLLETETSNEEVFRWTNLAGTLAGHVGGCTPRGFSPCGVTLDRNSPQLFSYPGRYFHYFNAVQPAIVEGLVIPLTPLGRDPLGTIWIVTHDPGHKFDAEDVRLMTSLAEFVSSSIRLLRLLEQERQALQMAQSEIVQREQIEEVLRAGHAELASLVEQRTSVLRLLSSRLLRSQDDERRRIARELHDSVGQYLVSLKMNLAGLRRAHDEERRSELIAECEGAADDCLAETRTISYLLHPPLLDESGFASAARWYLDGFAQRSGIAAEICMPETAERLPDAAETVLFRVLQESLTNVHRHSGSATVSVALELHDGQAKLRVRDFGRGIPLDLLERFRRNGSGTGIGMAGMRERVTDLGGDLEISSGPHGTAVTATIPIPSSLGEGLSVS